MKAVVAAFNQEKALVGAFSVITNLRVQLFEALLATQMFSGVTLVPSLVVTLPTVGSRSLKVITMS